MDLAAVGAMLEAAAARVATEPFVALPPFDRNGRVMRLVLTARFVQRVRRARLWNSVDVLTAVKNAAYGFDPARARSVGGRDGVFLLDRSFDNAMTRKLFGQYLDKPSSGAADLAAFFGVDAGRLQGVRVVSHHLRLLGVLHRTATDDAVGLVDIDRR